MELLSLVLDWSMHKFPRYCHHYIKAGSCELSLGNLILEVQVLKTPFKHFLFILIRRNYNHIPPMVITLPITFLHFSWLHIISVGFTWLELMRIECIVRVLMLMSLDLFHLKLPIIISFLKIDNPFILLRSFV